MPPVSFKIITARIYYEINGTTSGEYFLKILHLVGLHLDLGHLG